MTERNERLLKYLADNPNATFAQAGKEFGVTRARIQQIAKKYGITRPRGRRVA